MKTSQRHHLKDNEFAMVVSRAQAWLEQNRTALLGGAAAVAVVAGGLLGYVAWQRSIDTKAASLLAEAMVISEAQVQPPAPPAGTTNDPSNPGGQLPGTYPTLDAKLGAALPKFLAAADAYPDTAAGQTARLHAAETLGKMGRRDEAIQQYDRLMGSANALMARAARLGKASVQLGAGQYDPAIATLKELSEQKDSALPAEALLMELARAYKMAGKTEDARKTLTQVVEQHADSQYATDAKAEIAKLKS
ncbi:MAG: tetratricopeptide repeat protein [Acidobacteriota bacterium]|nr:tetratricopeptide repeat protein [Acidobacteriota bacterium]